MKLNLFRSLAFVSVLLLGAATASAYDFEVDGIFYNKNADGLSATVTYKNSGGNYYKGAVVIPASVTCSGKTYSVTAIGDRAFYQCSGLTSVVIPNSVTTIGGEAFNICDGLTSIEIPNSVTTIGYSTFCHSGLTSVVIPNSVTTIGTQAFSDCSGMASIIVESGNSVYDSRDNCNAIVETATNSLLFGCKNTTIPNSVTTIGDFAFRDCSGLTSIGIPNSVTTIGNSAFRGCRGLTSVEIPNSVTTIGSGAFESCDGLKSVSLGNSVTTIGAFAFYYCIGLTSIEIPNSVTAIGGSAFYNCWGLTSIEIPNSVTAIGGAAFNWCYRLKSVTSLNTIPPYTDYSTFLNVPSSCVLYVPTGSVEAYRVAEGWSRFTNIKALPAGVEGVDADAVTVRGENGVIRIDGAEGAMVEVYNAAGVCVYSGEATEVPVPQRGIYVVKVAGRATKLAL